MLKKLVVLDSQPRYFLPPPLSHVSRELVGWSPHSLRNLASKLTIINSSKLSEIVYGIRIVRRLGKYIDYLWRYSGHKIIRENQDSQEGCWSIQKNYHFYF